MSGWTAGEQRMAGVVVALVVVAAGLAGLRLWRDGGDSALLRALTLAPGDAARYSWTDWDGVRRDLDARIGADSPKGEVAAFLDRAYAQDLSTASTIDDAAGLLHRAYGFSPATIEWELLAQSRDGMVIVNGLPDERPAEETAADIEDHLRDLGFSEPDGGGEVWSIDETALSGIDPTSVSMPALTHVAVDPEHRVVLTSDSAAYLQGAVDGLDDSTLPAGVSTAAEALGEPRSAFVTTGDYACAEMSLVDADPVDQAQAEELIAQAGKLNPFTGFAMGVQPGEEPPRDVEVAMTFENEDQARTNADTRSRLAVGPAPGQGGTFAERFRLGEVRADGSVLTMQLHPRRGEQPFADLASGSVLFATC